MVERPEEEFTSESSEIFAYSKHFAVGVTNVVGATLTGALGSVGKVVNSLG